MESAAPKRVPFVTCTFAFPCSLSPQVWDAMEDVGRCVPSTHAEGHTFLNLYLPFSSFGSPVPRCGTQWRMRAGWCCCRRATAWPTSWARSECGLPCSFLLLLVGASLPTPWARSGCGPPCLAHLLLLEHLYRRHGQEVWCGLPCSFLLLLVGASLSTSWARSGCGPPCLAPLAGSLFEDLYSSEFEFEVKG